MSAPIEHMSQPDRLNRMRVRMHSADCDWEFLLFGHRRGVLVTHVMQVTPFPSAARRRCASKTLPTG